MDDTGKPFCSADCCPNPAEYYCLWHDGDVTHICKAHAEDARRNVAHALVFKMGVALVTMPIFRKEQVK